nr:MAG TPA: DNA-directed RNA polymerase [Caudoviricetes sp.]
MTKNEEKAVRFIENIKNNAVVTLDHIAREEPNVSPLLYRGREEKADTILAMIQELEQYRAIGTPEECRKSLEICKAMVERNITPDDMENYMKFEDECIKQGFTLVGLLKAGEKHEAMEPIRMDKCTCPSCGTHNEVWKKRRNTLPSGIVYCWHCGQAVEIKRSDK